MKDLISTIDKDLSIIRRNLLESAGPIPDIEDDIRYYFSEYLRKYMKSSITPDAPIVQYKVSSLGVDEVLVELIKRPFESHHRLSYSIVRTFDEGIEYRLNQIVVETVEFVRNYPLPRRITHDNWLLPKYPELFVEVSMERILKPFQGVANSPESRLEMKKVISKWMDENIIPL